MESAIEVLMFRRTRDRHRVGESLGLTQLGQALAGDHVGGPGT
jgi:hypothetical protein